MFSGAGCPSRSQCRVGKLDVNCEDPVGITICETAEERTEELPLATWLVRTDDFAVDDAISNEPIHPARVGQILVLNPPAAPCCLESAQFPRPHRIDEGFVKVCTRAFDNLKPDHSLPAPVAHLSECLTLVWV
jgi:hypothetical protein